MIVMMTKWWKALQSARSKMVGPPRLLRSPPSAPFWKSISPNYYYCHFAIVIIISYSWIVSFFFIFHTYVKFTYCDYTKCGTPSLLPVTQWWVMAHHWWVYQCQMYQHVVFLESQHIDTGLHWDAFYELKWCWGHYRGRGRGDNTGFTRHPDNWSTSHSTLRTKFSVQL